MYGNINFYDLLCSHVDLKDIVSVKIADKKLVSKVFPWVRVAIAAAKRWTG